MSKMENSISSKLTFIELASKYEIEIPIIQRDYAQGRMIDKIPEVRKNFLQSLFEAITLGKKLDFDFVYGSIEEGVFIPLDGQQRLTTLFLLHWYLAIKDGDLAEFRKTLKKFTYETRMTSREFCEAILINGAAIQYNSDSLVELIMDSPWFYLSWKKDPTIQSMLVMLEDIHLKFNDITGGYKLLCDPLACPVFFHFVELEDFGLTDNLYIRMNARGKQLTDFENFKARFEQFLEDKFPDKQMRFSTSVDGKWTDLFWKKEVDKLIDEPFLNFFSFITEILYIQNVSSEEVDISDFEVVKKVYSETSAIDFLFSALDAWSEVGDSGDFFGSLFNDSSETDEEEGVMLFDTNTDLFERCVRNNQFLLKEKILLFAVTAYLIWFKVSLPDQRLRNKIRVLRNLLNRIRQAKQRVFVSNLRSEDLQVRLPDIWQLVIDERDVYEALVLGFDMPSFKEYLPNEVVKARLIQSRPLVKDIIFELEDHWLIRGQIHNFEPENQVDNLVSISNAFYEIWGVEDNTLIIRALLSIGDYAIKVGESAKGDRYYFGEFLGWNQILTVSTEHSETIKKILVPFLDAYLIHTGNPNERLQAIIDKFLKSDPVRDWQFYFVKYPKNLEVSYWGSQKLYEFAWSNDDYQIRALTRDNLRGRHINPFSFTVSHLVNDKKVCDIERTWVSDFADEPLYLANNVSLRPFSDGWQVCLTEILDDFPQDIIARFKLEWVDEGDFYLLRETPEKDRIEIAADFCRAAYKL